jgi:hypothetical protein
VQVNVNFSPVDVYECEVLHVPAIQWSSIRILSSNDMKTLTTSNLIGSAQLPTFNQIQEGSFSLDFDPLYEKAMLVKNGDGDFAIVKGKWVGFKQSVVVTRGRRRHVSRVDPGYLLITIVFLEDELKIELKLDYSYLSTIRFYEFHFEMKDVTVSVDLSKATIDIRKESGEIENSVVENLIATVLSVSTLHVLLQPKPKPYEILGNQIKLIDKSFNIDHNRVLLFGLIGYDELIESEWFMNQYQSIYAVQSGDESDENHHNCEGSWLFTVCEDAGGGKASFWIDLFGLILQFPT